MRLSPSITLLLFACSNDVQVSQTANVEPAASITSPSDGDTLTTAEPAELVGTIADGNGLDDVVSVVWDSSIDGILSEPPDSMPDANGTTRASALLSEGTHILTLTATDSAGVQSVADITVAGSGDRRANGSWRTVGSTPASSHR